MIGYCRNVCGRIVVIGAAHVFMVGAGLIAVRLERELAIERVLQDGAQALIRASLQLESALAGRFQPLVGVGFGQAQDAEARAISHLRMRLGFQNRTNHLCRGRADGFGPVNQARRSPFQMRLMTLGPVIGIGGVPVSGAAAQMGSDAHAIMEDLDSAAVYARL